jgi:hypothetical protein
VAREQMDALGIAINKAQSQQVCRAAAVTGDRSAELS